MTVLSKPKTYAESSFAKKNPFVSFLTICTTVSMCVCAINLEENENRNLDQE